MMTRGQVFDKRRLQRSLNLPESGYLLFPLSAKWISDEEKHYKISVKGTC